jgi:hypothetical protein
MELFCDLFLLFFRFRIHEIVHDEEIHVITKSPLDAHTCYEMKGRTISSRSVSDVKSKSVCEKHEWKMFEIPM